MRKFLKSYLFKMLRPLKKQMDFDLAIFLMLNAMRAPNKLYQHTKRLKQIRNQWHRDDPCLTFAIIGLLLVTGIIYGLLLPQSCLLTSVKFVVLHFILSGIILSTICRWVADTYMVKLEKKEVQTKVEPMYAFDIHCNGFFPVYVFSYALQVHDIWFKDSYSWFFYLFFGEMVSFLHQEQTVFISCHCLITFTSHSEDMQVKDYEYLFIQCTRKILVR